MKVYDLLDTREGVDFKRIKKIMEEFVGKKHLIYYDLKPKEALTLAIDIYSEFLT